MLGPEESCYFAPAMMRAHQILSAVLSRIELPTGK